MSVKVLLVGAGAVGLVYGRHLQLGGAEVSFLVKPAYEAASREGFSLYPLNDGRDCLPVRWEGAGVLTSPEEVAQTEWDQVWLCVSSTALRGAWLDDLCKAIGGATLVSLQPGLEDKQYLLERVYESQLVQGVITFISYQTPLETEQRPEPGVAYWFPPLAPSPFSGTAERVKQVVNTLRAGRCPAVVQRDATRGPAFISAVMMPHLVALELAGWSWKAFARSPHLELATDASHEAMKIVAKVNGTGVPIARWFVWPWVVRLAMRLAPYVIPIDMETYLKYHFLKVGDQTRMMMETYIQRGKEFEIPVQALQKFRMMLLEQTL